MKLQELPSRPPFEALLKPPQVLSFMLKDDGHIPNNPTLPLLVYEAAINLPETDPAAVIERLLAANHWCGSWRNGIYSYHHYHSNAHEVLAVFQGSATVLLGGEEGITRKIRAGDVIIIPAGVGHKNAGASADFGVVGAYPRGQDWDLCRGKSGERPHADRNIARVRLPDADPVYGPEGPLIEQWHGRLF